MKDQSRQPKGKIYCKYFNTIRTLKISGLMAKNTNERRSIKSSKNGNFSRWNINNYGKHITANLNCIY